MPGQFALMWSGGKDSALALQRAQQAGLEVGRLVTFYEVASGRVRFHATRPEMLAAQAAALGIELEAIGTSWPEMGARFDATLAVLNEHGFAGVIFGNIHLADVRAWYEARVVAAGLRHVEPIWGDDPADLVTEFAGSGGRAVITCVELAKLEESWLGRMIDERFPAEIAETGSDPCGENGEYHSFAFDGPAFSRPVRWEAGDRRREAGFAQLDLLAAAEPDAGAGRVSARSRN